MSELTLDDFSWGQWKEELTHGNKLGVTNPRYLAKLKNVSRNRKSLTSKAKLYTKVFRYWNTEHLPYLEALTRVDDRKSSSVFLSL